MELILSCFEQMPPKGWKDGWEASAAWVDFGRTDAIQGIRVDTHPSRLPFVDMSRNIPLGSFRLQQSLLASLPFFFSTHLV